ncbi:Zn-ribbon domain-containing OB-fold protein [Nocardioides sambongensis]|uniref:Zn-ribbon domain-containing OB-fold protein n=1 Tax=Nocardioides sambongensis TaxID=2589074 RepID=UPI00112E1423|nr:OB-fold domain-containing protein [Nocardioides sambongensis]
MSARNIASADPLLYDVDDSGVPTLTGLRDSAGNVSFPFQDYGSEANGDHGDAITRVVLAGAGTISAVTDVHVHPDPAVPTPYRLASVVLDEGPVVRAVLVDAAEASIGTRVRAITVPATRDDIQVAELRFTPTSAGTSREEA